MRISRSASVGVSLVALLIGLTCSGKSIYNGIQNLTDSRAYKTTDVKRTIDIEENVLPELDNRNFFLEHRKDVQEYGDLLTDTTNMQNLGRYEGHTRSANKSLARYLPLSLLATLIGAIGTWVEGNNVYIDIKRRRQRKKVPQKL